MSEQVVLEDALAAPETSVASRVGGQALILLAGNLFTLAVGLPLQIYVSRTLGSAGLGSFSLLDGFAGTVAGLLGFGLAQTAVRFIPQFLEQGDVRAIPRLVGIGAALLSTVGLLGYAAYAVSLLAFSPKLHLAPALVLVMGAAVPLSLLGYFAQQILRGFQDIRYMVVGSSFVQLTTKAIVTVLFFAAGYRLLGYAGATVTASAVGFLWLGFGVVRKLRQAQTLPQRAQSAVRWKRFAALQYGVSLLGLPANYLDRFLLGYFAGASPVGILAVAKQLQQLPGVIYQMLIAVAAPMFASAHARAAREEQAHLYALTTDWATKSALPLMIFLFVFAEPVLGLFGSQFMAGQIVLKILVVSQFANLATGPAGHMATMSGLEREAFRIEFATKGGLAVLLCLLVPLWGLTAVAICFLADCIATNVLSLRLLRVNLGIHWWNRRYLDWILPALATLATALALSRWRREWNPILLALVFLAHYAVFAAVMLARGLHEDDHALMRAVKLRFGFQ